MNYYYDTEFLEGTQRKTFLGIPYGKTPPTIDLISIGIVSDDGREYYAISKDFNLKEAWNRYDEKVEIYYGDLRNQYPNGRKTKVYWIRENVLFPIYDDLVCQYCNDSNNKPLSMYWSYKWLNFLIEKYGKSNKQIAEEVIKFVYPNVLYNHSDCLPNQIGDTNSDIINLYGYYSAYDHCAMCWLFGRMIDLPKGFPMYTIDLKQTLDSMWYKQYDKIEGQTRDESWLKSIKAHPNYPKETNAHNALADADWNRRLHEFIKSI